LKSKTSFSILFAGLAYYFTPESFYKPVAQVLISDADKMSIASKIASNILKRAPSGPESTYADLWKEHTCVVVFLRRFG